MRGGVVSGADGELTLFIVFSHCPLPFTSVALIARGTISVTQRPTAFEFGECMFHCMDVEGQVGCPCCGVLVLSKAILCLLSSQLSYSPPGSLVLLSLNLTSLSFLINIQHTLGFLLRKHHLPDLFHQRSEHSDVVALAPLPQLDLG